MACVQVHLCLPAAALARGIAASTIVQIGSKCEMASTPDTTERWELPAFGRENLIRRAC
jgi:hypothetical protein